MALRVVTVKLPEDLATWLDGQGNKSQVIRDALEIVRAGGHDLNPPAPTKKPLVRTKTVKYWEDGYEYEREVPIP